MPHLSHFETASFCSPRKTAMRQDALAYCDRGKTRGDLAEALRISESRLNQWLSPAGPEMPESFEDRWIAYTGSAAIITAGAELTDPYDMLVRDLIERFSHQLGAA